MIREAFDTPWKILNGFRRWTSHPLARILFALNGIPWGRGWRFYGLPMIQKHRKSCMRFGNYLQLRSTLRSNPLGPCRPVILCTWMPGAVLETGDHFAMTGGTLCAAERIVIGNNVTVGANAVIIDTDFHPAEPRQRNLEPQAGKTAPVFIEDDVFIGMNSIILKGVRIGRGTTVGAGSVVTSDVSEFTVIAGNPAHIVSSLDEN